MYDLDNPNDFFHELGDESVEPHKRLMRAVLFRAIKDFVDPIEKTLQDRTVKRSAESWFLDTKPSENPFTFRNICTYLGYDPKRTYEIAKICREYQVDLEMRYIDLVRNLKVYDLIKPQ